MRSNGQENLLGRDSIRCRITDSELPYHAGVGVPVMVACLRTRLPRTSDDREEQSPLENIVCAATTGLIGQVG